MRLFALFILLVLSLASEELRIKAENFTGDQAKGISVFEGDVNIIKGSDELNATKVTVYTDENQKPTKFVAEGDASFYIVTDDGSIYTGKAQKAIYMPNEKEYHFYKQVRLRQINEKKEIIGDEVVLKSLEGKAYAKGAKSEPVIMIFDIEEKK